MINLKIVTPDGLMIDKNNCLFIGIPGSNGMFEVYSQHMKLFTKSKTGILYYNHDNYLEKILISNSFIYIDYISVLVISNFLFFKNSINLELEKNKLSELLSKYQDLKDNNILLDLEKDLELCKLKIELF